MTRQQLPERNEKIEQGSEGVLTLTLRNPASVPQTKSIRRDLPREISEADLLDTGGLNIGRDEIRGNLFLYLNEVELAPKQEQVFEVRFRDSWGVPETYLSDLRLRADEMKAAVSESDTFPPVVKFADRIVADVVQIDGEEKPGELSARYIAYYRDLRTRLDDVERDLLRMDDVMNPPTRPSEDASASGDWSVTKAPDTRTTWGIIWGISIFLLIVGLSTLGRWMSLSKNETIG